jgi:hypothetical protein
MPLQATSGAASYDAFGGGVPVVPNYIEDVFSTWLYNGDTGGYIFASSGVSITTGGMMWVKSRGSATNNYIFSPSLTSANHYLNTNTTAAQSNSGVTNNNFEALDNGGGMRFGGAFSGISDSATGPYASWTFKKQPKFFDVVTYTGNGTAGRTVSHNLGSAPGCIIVKRTDGVTSWATYHRSLGGTKYLTLNTTDASGTNNGAWNDTNPTDSVFTVGDGGFVNTNGATYVAYLFAHDAGGFGLTGTDNVISCGSFTTDGSGNATVSLGYEPQWVMIKETSGVGQWWIQDTMRGFSTSVSSGALLRANTSGAEIAGAGFGSPTSTGFTISGQTGSATHIYIAIRRGPMKVPTSGTSVLGLSARSGTGANATVTGGAGVSDAVLVKNRGSAVASLFAARLTATNYLVTSSTAAQVAAGTTILQANPWDVMDGVKVGTTSTITNASSNTYINYLFNRAPSVFDVVCYTGTGSATTFTHNLGVVPEIMIVKRRSATGEWRVYVSSVGANDSLKLQTNEAPQGGSAFWDSTTPTASVFTVGTSTDTNASGSTYINHLFATCAGVSKVGSYTGTATTKQINCGFTGGARFVLIKRTDATGDWYVWDSARGIIAGNDPYFVMNSIAAEETGTDYIDTYSLGFEISSSAPTGINESGGTYIFLAIA